MKPPANTESIAHASINWDEQGQPVSNTFGDIYFSSASGLEESRHVFLHHNQLSERWQTLAHDGYFTIAETGFGSGLNFLAAWDLWLKLAPETAQLHFVSVEKFPLCKTDLTRALALWPELAPLSTLLIDVYPVFVGKGFQRINFMHGRIKLTLIIDDAARGFSQLLATTHPLFARTGATVDAWFLDGFAPAKNPQMWSDELFDCINKLSHKQTTAATFSAAAIVKNGLKNAGFRVQKVAGFGRKRDMVKAVFNVSPELVGSELVDPELNAAPEPLNPEQYSFRGGFSPYPIPWTIQLPKPVFKQRHAIIIGGGLAGCHSARALAERGWKITLIERHNHLAQEGSGNPQGVLYAKLSPGDETQAAFNLTSLEYALRFYKNAWPAIGSACGLLQLAHKPTEVALQQLLRKRFAHASPLVEFVDAEQATQLAGVQLTHGGLYFPQSGWIDPPKLCAALVNHPNIHTLYQTEALALQPLDDGWQISTAAGFSTTAPVVIIATAKDALAFPQANHLPIKSIRGQVSYLPQTTTSPALKTVICAEGYLCPANHNRFCTGATFNLNDQSTETRVSDHQTNLNNLQEHLPHVAECWNAININELVGRVSFRCSLPDYLPALGALPRVDELVRDFAPLRKNAKAGVTTPGAYFTGLYINIGHGARGLAYTPLCAELLAAQINNEVLPVATALANALNPARFVIRDLIRNKR